ncbi:hypothetical protein BGAL_0013g00180 [Botrytis galanthina]|uniref:Uncharacterized protein n=1 Tax=Botrytis galanthina TaxID=278940 RepID=A0A4S8RAG0_9HELO|nr:hypothetical protein BGAL_0013g00180 [Botrytis galanthina]
MSNKQPNSHTQSIISSELSTPRIVIDFTSSSSVESQTRKKPRTKEVQITMEHSGPLALWKIEERAKQKEELDFRKKLRDPRTQSNTRHSSADKFSSRDASTQTNLSYSSAVSVLLEKPHQTSSAGGTTGLLSMCHNGMEHSNSRLVSSNISKQDERISPNVTQAASMVAKSFPSAIGSCAMHATSLSRIAPAEPTDFFLELGQHPPAAVLAVAASPTRVLPIIDSSLSVAASSTDIGGVALDGHLRSEFPAQVQLFDSIPATASQTPVGRSAIASNASMQVSPRPLRNDTINEIIDTVNSLMFNTPWYNLCPRIYYWSPKKCVYTI